MTDDSARRIQAIARYYDRVLPGTLGWVRFAEIRAAEERNELLSVNDVDGKLVAWILFHTRRDGCTVVYSLGVHPQYRGQHIAHGLMTRLQTSKSWLRLKVKHTNIPALAFYRKHGFVSRGRDPRARSMILMEWRKT